jgi:putative oxidoreductase
MANVDSSLDRWRPEALAVLRIMTGLLFLSHGTGKLLGFPDIGMNAELFSLVGLSAVLELVGGILLVLGLFTRPVAFILSGEMAVAYFMAHAPQGFFPIVNQGELAVLYCFVFLYFVFAGAGAWSIDNARTEQERRLAYH